MIFKFVFLLVNLALAGDNLPSDFLSLCKVALPQNEESLQLCNGIYEKFFLNNKTNDIAPFKPSDVGADSSPIDAKIQFIIFNDPNYMSGMSYCYFLYKNWIDEKTVTPDVLSSSASGFSILNEDVAAYEKWMRTSPKGKACKELVMKEAEVSTVNLEDSLKKIVAIIGINPYAMIKKDHPTLASVMNEIKTTVNHERVHAYQVLCKDFEAYSMKAWTNLPTLKKNDYIKKYNSYNWSNLKTAGREYVAYLDENNFAELLKQTKNCKLKK